MKTAIGLLFVVVTTSYSQVSYPLGEREFTQTREQATLFTSFNPKNYPPLVDSVDLSAKLPPAGNQGTKGSCWAWATTYIMRSIMDGETSFVAQSSNLDDTKVYSPEYVYQYYKGDANDCNWGAFSYEMLDRILKDGAVKEAEFPHRADQCNIKLPANVKLNAKNNIKLGYRVQVVEDLYSVKKVLSDGQPLVISIKVDDYFGTAGNITSKAPFWNSFGTRVGSHAMVVVGYNNRLNAVKVLNSWGQQFGDKGYVWISYSIVNSAMNYSCYPKKEMETLPITVTPKEEDDVETAILNNEFGYKLSQSTWAKEGYYRKFGTLKIVLSEVSNTKGFAVVQIKDKNDSLKANFYIEPNTSKSFFVDGSKFDFTLDNIAAAGHNPFKKAAYFTIARKVSSNVDPTPFPGFVPVMKKNDLWQK